MHMGGLMIANLILSLMSQLGSAWEIYYCKTKKEIDEWKTGVKLHRLVVYETSVYMVLESQIISFTAPYTQTNECGNVHLMSSLPFAKKHSEKANSMKVVGYLLSNELIYELYDSQMKNRLIGYSLDFERNLADKKEGIDSIFFYSNEVNETNFIFAFQHQRVYTAVLLYRQDQLNFFIYGPPVHQFDFRFSPRINQTVRLPYKVRYAALYKREFDEDLEERGHIKGNNEHFLIEVDYEQNLHVRQVGLPNMLRDEKLVRLDKTASIGLSNFLSCHQPFESPGQVGVES